jgi:hypothetical protein
MSDVAMLVRDDFTDGVDGTAPAGLVASGTSLFATTVEGGATDGGAIFKRSP